MDHPNKTANGDEKSSEQKIIIGQENKILHLGEMLDFETRKLINKRDELSSYVNNVTIVSSENAASLTLAPDGLNPVLTRQISTKIQSNGKAESVISNNGSVPANIGIVGTIGHVSRSKSSMMSMIADAICKIAQADSGSDFVHPLPDRNKESRFYSPLASPVSFDGRTKRPNGTPSPAQRLLLKQKNKYLKK